jgi:NAD(P)-dependent dehydrogenase (short-subunit alcohol dehydrogenase family)
MMAQPLELTGQTILITGGARGIGGATAELCAARGAAVVIADTDAENATATVSRIQEAGGKAQYISTDIRHDDQVHRLMTQIETEHGRLDGMVCAAGVLRGPHLQPEEFPLDEFELTMDVNVKGTFLCVKYATPLLVAAQGRVVIVASGAGVRGGSSSIAYGTSKGGENGMGMTLERHLGPRGVRVNVICPGNIVTDMKLSVDIAAAERAGRSVQEAIDRAERDYGIPAGVAKIIAFMLSDEADYLRGTLFTR